MNFHRQHGNRGITVLEITPLVDVVFLLLIFFLLTATYVRNPNLDISLPKATLNQLSTQQKDLTVAITEEGEIRYDGQEISVEKLEGILRAEFAVDQESIVVVQADTDSKHGKVVEVMDLAKKIGFARLAIAVQTVYGTEP
jgi:biopolymer transport protein ExbD